MSLADKQYTETSFTPFFFFFCLWAQFFTDPLISSADFEAAAFLKVSNCITVTLLGILFVPLWNCATFLKEHKQSSLWLNFEKKKKAQILPANANKQFISQLPLTVASALCCSDNDC